MTTFATGAQPIVPESQTYPNTPAVSMGTSQWRGARTRQQDIPLLTGDATFIDDVALPGMQTATFLRSSVAHARIVRIDVDRASKLPGVRAVYTGADLAAHLGPQPIVWTSIESEEASSIAIAVDTVRYQGHIIALVVADTRATGEDALDLIDVEFDVLPAVTTVEAAMAPGAPLLHEGWASNRYGGRVYRSGDVEQAWEEADVVVEETLRFGRQTGAPLEPRGCVADWNPHSGELDITISAQSPNRVREFLGDILGIPLHRLRVRVPALGGGFGTKADFYAEEVLTCLASRLVGRPVKFIEDRAESFHASAHAREQILTVSLAARQDGTILGLRGKITGVLGGEIGSTGMGPTWLGAALMPGPYRIGHVEVEIQSVVTNKTPYGAYRGWGQPKGNFAMERVMDSLSRELGIDPVELRRMNLVAADDFPYANGMGQTYDSGRYAETLDLALTQIDELGWRGRRENARKEGRRLGIGLACYVEATAPGPSRAMNANGMNHSGFDQSYLKMDSTGGVTLLTGHTDMGQGLLTVLAEAVAQELGLSPDEVQVRWGDTAAAPYTGYGTGGSRAGALATVSARIAARKLRAKIVGIAAYMLKAPGEQIELAESHAFVRGERTRRLPIAAIGMAAYRRIADLEPGTEPTLVAHGVHDPSAQAYANGVAAALVEVDPETGQTKVCDYVVAHDCGTVLNHDIVVGQIQGATAQALGGALSEELVYGQDGRLRTTDFVDYVIPSATEVPTCRVVSLTTPSPVVPGGMKGAGEGGSIPAASAIASAIDDAFDQQIFVSHVPATPERLYRLIATHLSPRP